MNADSRQTKWCRTHSMVLFLTMVMESAVGHLSAPPCGNIPEKKTASICTVESEIEAV